MLPTSIKFRSTDQRKRSVGIVYADQRFLVADKPAGIPVIPDRWHKAPVNLRDLLQREYNRFSDVTVQVVHRIDQDTSGLVLFALDTETHRELNSLFEENRISKSYLAFCRGQAAQMNGTIDLPLQPSAGRSYRTVVSRNGKAAQTAFRVLEQYREFCLVEVRPVSGRTHQIRVHMQQIGLPLAVDPLYSETKSLSIFDIKRRRTRKTSAEDSPSLIDRLTLHAATLSFEDPRTGKEFLWSSPLPADLAAVHKALQKYGRLQSDESSSE